MFIGGLDHFVPDFPRRSIVIWKKEILPSTNYSSSFAAEDVRCAELLDTLGISVRVRS